MVTVPTYPHGTERPKVIPLALTALLRTRSTHISTHIHLHINIGQRHIYNVRFKYQTLIPLSNQAIIYKRYTMGFWRKIAIAIGRGVAKP